MSGEGINVLYLERSALYYGSTKNMTEFAIFLVGKKCRVTVLLGEHGETENRLDNTGVEVIVKTLPAILNVYGKRLFRYTFLDKLKAGFAWLVYNLQVIAAIRKNRYDVLFVNNTRSYLFYLWLISFQKIRGTKIVWRIQIDQPIHVAVRKVLSFLANKIVIHGGRGVVETIFNRTESMRYQHKILIAKNCIDIDRYAFDAPISEAAMKRQLALPIDSTVIFMVSLIERRKGIHIILSMLPELLRSCPNVVFLHVGGLNTEAGESRVYMAELESLQQELGIKERVFFAGYRSDVAAVGSVADVFVLPSSSETQPYVISEASLLGLPSIAFDVGSIKDQIISGKTGYLIAPNNSHDFTRRLTELLTDPEKRRRMGESAKKHVEKEFNKKICDEKLYSEIVTSA
jgi:glycosyltransferase involved in cell wall biosynthesis